MLHLPELLVHARGGNSGLPYEGHLPHEFVQGVLPHAAFPLQALGCSRALQTPCSVDAEPSPVNKMPVSKTGLGKGISTHLAC